MRKVAWVVMVVFALAIASYAAAVFLLPSFGPPFVQQFRATTPLALYMHLGGGALAMGLGPWQFNDRIRQRALQVHRWTGRGYVVSVLIGGTGALALAPRSQQGLVTHVGFGLLALLWLGTTTRAYLAIRAGNLVSHRRWMTRSFALTLAAVTLRIYLPLSQMAGIPFPDAYQVISWLCWVPNLLIAEWFVLRRDVRRSTAAATPSTGAATSPPGITLGRDAS